MKCPRCKSKVGVPVHEYWNKDHCQYRKDYFAKAKPVRNVHAKAAIVENVTEEVGSHITTLSCTSPDITHINIAPTGSTILDIIKPHILHSTLDTNIIIDSGANATIVNDHTIQQYTLSPVPLHHRHDLTTCSGDKVEMRRSPDTPQGPQDPIAAGQAAGRQQAD
jgi:hypothetical protein